MVLILVLKEDSNLCNVVLPKFGFTSRIARVTAEIRLDQLEKVKGDVVDLDSLRAARLINNSIQRAKIFLSGTLKKSVIVKGKGLRVTKGARLAIEAAGGTIEEDI